MGSRPPCPSLAPPSHDSAAAPLDTRNTEFLSLLAFAHLKCGGAAAAADLLAALRVVDPGNPWVMRTLAYAKLQAGDFRGCLDHLDGWEASRSDKALTLVRSRALWGLGQRDEARRVAAGLDGKLRGLGGAEGRLGGAEATGADSPAGGAAS